VNKFFLTLLDWSELWATILPIIVWILKKPQQKVLLPIKIYLFVSFILNIIIDLANFKIYKNNNPLYNLESIFRLFIFMWFFLENGIPISTKKFSYLVSLILILIVINFLFWGSFIKFDSPAFSIEAITLIVYCVTYFLKKLKEDNSSFAYDPSLIIITGLAIYETVCFPVFLFYQTLAEQTKDYAVNIWDVHNIAYIVFCLFIARAFYGSSKHTTD
jgi:hypothetical protein